MNFEMILCKRWGHLPESLNDPAQGVWVLPVRY
jgi:hypothetical protein